METLITVLLLGLSIAGTLLEAAEIHESLDDETALSDSTLQHITPDDSNLLYVIPEYAKSNGLKCPPGQSMIYEESLRSIIDEVIKRDQLFETLNDTFYQRIQDIYDKHSTDLNNFLDWIDLRPNNLKNIVETLVQTRARLKPLFEELYAIIKWYPESKKYYEDVNNYFEQLKSVYKGVKVLCQYNCIEAFDTAPFRRSLSPLPRYYCGTYSNVLLLAKTHVKQIKNEITSDNSNLLVQLDELFAEKIKNYKELVKDAALYEFGPPMYEALNLVDEYYNFEQLLKSETEHNSFNETMELNKIFVRDLGENINSLQVLCLECYKSKHTLNRRSGQDEGNSYKLSLPQKYSDLIKEIVIEELEGLSRVIQNPMKQLFANLNAQLKVTPQEKYLKWKLIRADVELSIRNEREQLKKLKEAVPNSALEEIIQITTNAETFRNTVDNLNNEVVLDIGKYTILKNVGGAAEDKEI